MRIMHSLKEILIIVLHILFYEQQVIMVDEMLEWELMKEWISLRILGLLCMQVMMEKFFLLDIKEIEEIP